MIDVSVSQIENIIFVVRGQRVMLDSDLAELYGVMTKNLNKAVKRNIDTEKSLNFSDAIMD